jgi:hypothetical protein
VRRVESFPRGLHLTCVNNNNPYQPAHLLRRCYKWLCLPLHTPRSEQPSPACAYIAPPHEWLCSFLYLTCSASLVLYHSLRLWLNIASPPLPRFKHCGFLQAVPGPALFPFAPLPFVERMNLAYFCELPLQTALLFSAFLCHFSKSFVHWTLNKHSPQFMVFYKQFFHLSSIRR